MKYTPKVMTTILFDGTPAASTLTRPVTLDLARRLEACRNQIVALNTANKTLEDAATALGMEKPTLVNYLNALGIKWANKRTYVRRNPNRYQS